MAFNGTIQDISINMFGIPCEEKYVEIQQFDTASRTVRFHLKTFAGKEYKIPYDAETVLYVKRTDNEKIKCNGIVENENTITVTFPQKACVCVGKQAAQIYLYSQSGDIRSQIFYLRISEAICGTGEEKDDDDPEIVVKNNRNGIVADLSENNAGSNHATLLTAIEEANKKNTYVRILAGNYIFTKNVEIPEEYNVRIVGDSDSYAITKEDVNGEKHPTHRGSCLIYRGTDKLFKNSGNVTLSLENLTLLNEREDKTYMQKGRVFGQGTVNHSTKGKVYIKNCCIAGWRYAFGNAETNEYCCVLASRVRWSYCLSAVDNNVDGRILDCSINKCTNGMRFDGDSGFTTISNNRIEWCTETGILLNSNGVHDLTIVENEFDRCGKPAIQVNGGKRLTISTNMFRRNGVDMDTGYHIQLENATDAVITSNNTRYMEILDTSGTHPKKPEFSYSVESCTNLVMSGNNWLGCGDPQADDSESSGLSLGEKEILLALLKGAAYTSKELVGSYNALMDLWNAEPTEKLYHAVSSNLDGVTLSNSAKAIQDGATYNAVLTANDGYAIGTVTVTMGGTDITSSVYTASSRTIQIDAVTGDVIITATAIVPVSSVILDRTAASLTAGESLTLTATVLPENATDKTVTWTSSGAEATVTDGVVKAMSAGSVTITAKAGDKTATCQLTIEKAKVIPVQSVSFAETSGSIKVGETMTLVPVITPSNATETTATWTSSKPAVATVSDGKVTALSVGNTVITVAINGKMATYTLVVAEDTSLVYNLPGETTFDPSEKKFIDTGIKLFENIDEKPSWTILLEVQYGENVQAASDSYCLAHCMEESSPWPGLSIAAWANGALGANVYGGKSQLGTMTKMKEKKRKLALKLEGTTATRWNTDKLSTTFTISGYNTAVDKTLILGAYQQPDGTKGRFFDGTLYQFLVYKKAMSDDDITAWVNG